MKNLLVYILLFLLLVLLIKKQKNVVETFQYHLTNEKILKRKLIFKNMPLVTIYKHQDVESNELKKIDKYLNNISVESNNNIESIKNKEHALYYTDAYTYSKNYKNYKILTMCSIPKQVLFVSSKDIDLIKSTLKIAYINDIDLEIFKIIMKSQKNYTNLNNYNFVKIKKNEVIPRLFGSDTRTTDIDIDLFIYYNTIVNPFLTELLKQKNFNLISYDYKITKLDIETSGDESKIKGGDAEYSLDSNLLKFYLPFSKKHIQTISKNVDDEGSSDNNNIIYNTLLIDTLLFTFNDDTGNKNTYMDMNTTKFNEIYKYILNYYNEYLKINYYLQHFEFLNLSKNWANEKQKTGSFHNVIETFDETYLKFKINPRNLVAIESNSKETKYKFNDLTIEGIPLKKNDELYSEYQGKKTKYTVEDIDSNYAYLVEKHEDKDETEFEPLYRCYQDNTILTKTECVDIVDKTGKQKPAYNWDRPCKTNNECPFYLSNKNYVNERGGCVNGYCELPVGLKRKSYREYDKEITENNYPRCHGCDINSGTDCCEKQKNDSKYKSPDYKFKNDNEDRRLSKFF